MPARKQPTPEPRPSWAFTDKGKVVACPKGPPDGAVLTCREGDATWTRLDPAQAAAPARRATVANGPTLYDETEAS